MKKLIILINILLMMSCSKYSIIQKVSQEDVDDILNNHFNVETIVYYRTTIQSDKSENKYIKIYSIYSECNPEDIIETMKKQQKERAEIEIIKFKEKLKKGDAK